MKPADAALGLMGGAFLLRALSNELPMYARIGYALAGWNLASGALHGTTAALPTSPVGIGNARDTARRAAPKLNFEARKVRTLAQRVAYINEQALKSVRDPSVYALARQVLTVKCGEDWCIPEKDHKGELEALFFEVKKRVRYTLDPVIFDAFQTPEKTLELNAGDCDDMYSLLAALLLSVGYPVSIRARIVHTQGFDTYNHIYLRAQLPNGEWVALDPTVNQPPFWEVPANQMVEPPKDYPIRG